MPTRKLLLLILAFTCAVSTQQGQERPPIVIRPPAHEDIILATPDVQSKSGDVGTELAGALQTFNQVLWDDLKFSGFFTMAGKSYYPPQSAARTEDLNYESWSGIPFKVSFVSSGTLSLVGGILRAELRVFDMKQRTMAFGQVIQGDVDQIRSIAHRWADEIVYKLTAGASKGIASTKIAYSSKRGAAKEIYVMDSDGNDQRAFTRNGSTNLFPNWSPDNSKLVFVSLRTGRWEINVHSYLDGSRLPFPLFNKFSSTPVISPDGTRILFSQTTARLDSDLFVAKLDGSERTNLTNHPGIDTSPTWSPSGRQVAFVSSRDGAGQIYIADIDGANVRRIVKEGGDADCPAWSPDGRWLAFHWKPHKSQNYDIYIAEVSSAKIFQLTSGSGSNESPTWAPDSRHLAFQSTRRGTPQIYAVLADGTEARMLTSQGANTSPSWGGYVRKDP